MKTGENTHHNIVTYAVPCSLFPVICYLLLVTCYLLIASPLHALSDDPETRYNRRIVWSGGEYAWRFAVEIDRLENGAYRSYLREFTTTLFINVSLPAGEYLFRIIPYDILDRPAEGTDWYPFVVRPPLRQEIADAPSPEPHGEVISVDDYVPGGEVQEPAEERTAVESDEAQPLGDAGRAARYNTVGGSAGSSFVDPVLIAAVHGTFSPMRHLFFEVGCDFGFFSVYDDVKSLFCLYPYANAAFFMPFREKGGFLPGRGPVICLAVIRFLTAPPISLFLGLMSWRV